MADNALDATTLLTYAALIGMAVTPIFFGSYNALQKLKSPKATKAPAPEFSDSSDDESEDESEVVSSEDAYMFPVYGSGVLFSLYLVFKYLNKEYVAYLVTAYFSIIGVPALTKLFAGTARAVTGLRLP
ncbi:hypothetical protein H4R34_006327, partial [Dimargaris verticillata]